MKRKIIFKDEPKYIWLGRSVPRIREEIPYGDGVIYSSTAPSYASALERIYSNSKMLRGEHSIKYGHGIIKYLDETHEDTFYLLMEPFSTWHELIDMDNKNET